MHKRRSDFWLRSSLRQALQKVDKTKLYDYNHHYDDQFCAWIESSDVVNYLFSLVRSLPGSEQEICRRIIANQDYPTLTDSNHSRITQKNHLKETTETWQFWSQNLSPGVLRRGAPGVSRHSTMGFRGAITLIKHFSDLSFRAVPRGPIWLPGTSRHSAKW